MNGKQAKRIRRMVYGDMSLRDERQYRNTTGKTEMNVGPRRKYLDAKKAYRR